MVGIFFLFNSISKATHAQAHPPTHTHALNHALARAHTHTHTQKYVVIIDFPLQQWFYEHASMLRYKYIACLVNI